MIKNNFSFFNVFKGFSSKKIWVITILAMADVLAMTMPFYLKNVFPNIHQELGVEEWQLTRAIAVYGYVSLSTYLLGGWLADKVSLKFLLNLGLMMIAVVGVWYGFIPFMNKADSQVYLQLIFIFAIWGFATNFIFWAPLWKLLSEQGTESQQGSVNGILGSINGLFGTIIIGIAFGVYYGIKNTGFAFPVLTWIISGAAFITCILIWIFVKEKETDKTFKVEKPKDTFKALWQVLTNYKIWLVSLLILGVYMFQTGLSFFIPYLKNTLKISLGVVFVLGLIRTYLLRFFSSPFAGKWADKSKKYIMFLTIGLIVNTIIIAVTILLPGFGNDFHNLSKWYQLFVQVSVSGLFLCLGLVSWCLVTNRWATINEINVPQSSYATAVGFISFVAFSPDAWFFHLASIIQENFSETELDGVTKASQTGNQIILLVLLAIASVGIMAGIILLIINKKTKK